MVKRSSRRRVTFVIAAAAMGAIVTLLVVEALLRVAPLVHDKSLVRYEQRLGDEGQSVLPDQAQRTLLGTLESVNEHGLRDPSRALERSDVESLRRVALLGDSLVWGFGLEDDEIPPRQLERHLTLLDPGHTWEAWNLGQPATNQINHAARFARLGPQIDPDVVLIFVLFNDLLPGATRFRITPQGYLASLSRDAPYPDWARPLLDRSVLFHLAMRAWYAREQRLRPGENQFLRKHMPDLLRGLGSSVSGVRAQGAQVAVVLMPGVYEPEGAYVELAHDLGRWCGSRQVAFIDLGVQLGVPLPDSLLLPGDSTHPNDLGAALIAEKLATDVLRLLSASERER